MEEPTDKSKCEAGYGTAHLPENVRAAIYDITNWETDYEDAASLALLAFSAGRMQVAAKLREWADGMDTPEWRDGWTCEIIAARAFASQIESGSL